ncbi:MAG: hypothetical protein EAZ08_12795 [Cytophagales bacterium]|nr:MAG: hypothetical protein EAZ08_12795 [Cytophagales bacterium]
MIWLNIINHFSFFHTIEAVQNLGSLFFVLFYFYCLKMIFDALQSLPKELFLNQKYVFQKTKLQYLS